MTKLKGTLPKGDANGLDHWRRRLLAEPAEVRVAVGLVEVVGYTVDFEQGTKIPAIKFEAIELVIDNEEDASAVMDILSRATIHRHDGLVTMDGTEPPHPTGELPIDLNSRRGAK